MSREFQEVGKTARPVAGAPDGTAANGCERGEQSIVLLNRRGYSRTLFCRSCGHVYTCPDCSISMTYHQAEGRLVCHYCGGEYARCRPHAQTAGARTSISPGSAPSSSNRSCGRFCPQAASHASTATPPGAAARSARCCSISPPAISTSWSGPRWLQKGTTFPNVTLVGVLAADAGLAFPDFRSAERTFQLLTQVAGRAGRGSVPGKVVIQSQYPDHYALRYARQQDYAGFYRHEVEYRRLMGYPPFRALVQILVVHESYMKAFEVADRVARALKGACASRAGEPLQVLGPAPAPLEKLRGKHRVQVLLKTPDAGCGHEVPMASATKAFDALAGAGSGPAQGRARGRGSPFVVVAMIRAHSARTRYEIGCMSRVLCAIGISTRHAHRLCKSKPVHHIAARSDESLTSSFPEIRKWHSVENVEHR